METKFKHGPWMVRQNTIQMPEVTFDGCEYNWKDNSEYLCISIDIEDKSENTEKLTSIANLIAAAPELYEALADLICISREGFCTPDNLDKAESILKKARGES